MPGASLHVDMDDRLYGVEGRWSLLRCPECGLVWLDPSPDAADMGRLYEAYHTHDRPVHPSFVQRVIRRGIPAAVLGYGDSAGAVERATGRLLAAIGPLRETARRSVMALSANRRGRLLDVGCGAGLFLSVMRDLGWEVSGTETDAAAAALARRHVPGAVVHTGLLEDVGLPDAGYDAVTLSHVIEHVPDPESTLRSCARLLRSGGRVVLATPNACGLGVSRFGRSWRGWEVPRHIHVFDPDTLARQVEKSGLTICSVETVTSAAFYLYLDGIRIERSTPGGPSAAGRPVGRFDQLWAVGFWLKEYEAVRRGRPVGEEVLLVAERTSQTGGAHSA
ncbi:MAG: class I SAM-dependent methyltransferase [Myxococcota bacterium]|nr:class I SAM-dependent methyltransferase [Myxococcota bacterium]MDP7431481.1 class I SAM-dependent methyltransferase [Myxococcota bacterium]